MSAMMLARDSILSPSYEKAIVSVRHRKFLFKLNLKFLAFTVTWTGRPCTRILFLLSLVISSTSASISKTLLPMSLILVLKLAISLTLSAISPVARLWTTSSSSVKLFSRFAAKSALHLSRSLPHPTILLSSSTFAIWTASLNSTMLLLISSVLQRQYSWKHYNNQDIMKLLEYLHCSTRLSYFCL